ncbi:DoxX family protein [Aminobacter sp. HY435]|uniref:DoxX family protein n=1 Tax=Aminobacter sp. HY435 TaxID=2970917 RepID=UPI0022B98104|nr:DoxX family protein [Aminobacter sp. HY435]
MLKGLVLLAARLLIAVLFVPAGVSTLTNISGSAGYFAGLGLPLPTLLAIVVGLIELLGGALVMVGFQVTLVCAGLALFAVAAGFIGHYGQGGGDPALTFMHQQALMKDIAISGGLLALAAAGGGALSLDRIFGRRPI